MLEPNEAYLLAKYLKGMTRAVRLALSGPEPRDS